jgi:hypothetical protein
MTVIAAGALLVVLFWLHSRAMADAEARRLEAFAHERAEFQAERETWRVERGELLNRIKPDAQQPTGLGDEVPQPPDFDDDDAYWSARDIKPAEPVQ